MDVIESFLTMHDAHLSLVGSACRLCPQALPAEGCRFMICAEPHGNAPQKPHTLPIQCFQKRLMLLGDTVDAQQALSMNLVTEVTEDPHARSFALAAQLCKKSKRSLGSIKRGLELATFPHADTVLQAEIDAASWCFADPAALDAFTKFRNRKKEPPVIDNAENKQQVAVPVQVKEQKLTHQTLSALLYDASTLHGEQVFLRFGDVDISYVAFAQDVARLAAGLHNIGVRSGDVVSALMFNSAQMVRAWFATMWLGAIWAPLHVRIPFSLSWKSN